MNRFELRRGGSRVGANGETSLPANATRFRKRLPPHQSQGRALQFERIFNGLELSNSLRRDLPNQSEHGFANAIFTRFASHALRNRLSFCGGCGKLSVHDGLLE